MWWAAQAFAAQVGLFEHVQRQLRGAAAAIDSGAAKKTLDRWAQAAAQQNGLPSQPVDRAIP